MTTTRTRPVHAWWASYGITDLWNELKPGLWQGGTEDDDTIFDVDFNPETGEPAWYPRVTKRDFDAVVTLYGGARPAGSSVQELRWSIPDSDDELDVEGLKDTVAWAHSRWKDGQRVLIRCQAGLNRSGLIMALVLIRDGMEPQAAIDYVRRWRAPRALYNESFRRFILGTPVATWR